MRACGYITLCAPHTLCVQLRELCPSVCGWRYACEPVPAARTANAVRCESNQTGASHELERQGARRRARDAARTAAADGQPDGRHGRVRELAGSHAARARAPRAEE